MNPEQLEKLKEWVEAHSEEIRDWLIQLNANFREVAVSPVQIPSSEIPDVWDLALAVWQIAEEVKAILDQYA